MKAPPPLVVAWTGKRRKLPMPIAEPATAMMMPILVVQVCLGLWGLSDILKVYYTERSFCVNAR